MEIEDMLAAVDRGEIDMAYCDEVGFTQAHPNRSAWTPVGECHASTTQRGKRLNVVGALMSSGELFAAMLFVGFLGLLMKRVGKPLVVILDNASVRKAKEIEPLLRVLEGKGLKLYFLPPPLPRIESHRKALAQDAQTLEADVDEVVAGFGTKYKLDFC